MTVPLMVLAAGSAFAGFLGLPRILGGSFIEGFLEPSFEGSKEPLAEVFKGSLEGGGIEVTLMVVSVVVALSGIGLATYLFKNRPELADRLAAAFPGVHRVLFHKYYVDELYDLVFVRGVALWFGNTFSWIDATFVDGVVNGVAAATRDMVAKASNLFDRFFVDGIVNAVALLFDNVSYAFRAIQDGLVQRYVLFMVMGFLIMLGLAASHWVL
jgi:NADH-quinone oxidoreductase subunit L